MENKSGWRSPLKFVVLLVAVAAICHAVIPGSHRAYTPTWFGLSELQPGIYSDAPERTEELHHYMRNAEETIFDYFGERHSFPRTIICTKDPCTETFGIDKDRLAGEAHGQSILFMFPNGINQETTTHELVHIVLGRKMDEFGMMIDAIPIWFNEGLATYLSEPQVSVFPASKEQLIQIRQLRSVDSWFKLVAQKGPTIVYATAGKAVSDVERKIGQKGIVEMINRSASGNERFDDLLVEYGLK